MPAETTSFSDSYVYCPHCLKSYQPEAGDFSETEREETCEYCHKTYLLYQSFTVTHHTRPKE